MSEINFHFTYQIGDSIKIGSEDRTLISKKSIVSFFNSLLQLKEYLPNSVHSICFFNDNSSSELLEFVQQQINKNKCDGVSLSIQNTIETGIYQSTRQSLHWLQVNGKDFVYPVKDYHIFSVNALKEMYEAINQFKFNSGYDILTSPFNDQKLWLAVYRNSLVPRTAQIENNTWIQYFNTSNSFMCIHQEYKKHWEIYNEFLSKLKDNSEYVSRYSLTYLLTKNAFIFIPVEGMACLIKEDDEDSYRQLWDTIILEE